MAKSRLGCMTCGDYRHGLHKVTFKKCPTCKHIFCLHCYSKMPTGKVGLLAKGRQCTNCNTVFK